MIDRLLGHSRSPNTAQNLQLAQDSDKASLIYVDNSIDASLRSPGPLDGLSVRPRRDSRARSQVLVETRASNTTLLGVLGRLWDDETCIHSVIMSYCRLNYNTNPPWSARAGQDVRGPVAGVSRKNSPNRTSFLLHGGMQRSLGSFFSLAGYRIHAYPLRPIVHQGRGPSHAAAAIPAPSKPLTSASSLRTALAVQVPQDVGPCSTLRVGLTEITSATIEWRPAKIY